MFADDEEGRLAEITNMEQRFQAGGMTNEQLDAGRKRLSGALLMFTARTPGDMEWQDRAGALNRLYEAELIDRGVNPIGVEMNPRYGPPPWDRPKGT